MRRRAGGSIDHPVRARRAGAPVRLSLIGFLACAHVLGSGCQGFGAGNQAESPPADNLSSTAETVETGEALAALTRMSEFLSSRPALRFEADIYYDAVQPSGQKLEFGSQRRIALRRPDHARVEVSHWDGEEELVTFDGQRLSVAIPNLHVYASTEFRGTSAEAFEHLVTEYDVASPLSDLLRGDLPEEVASRVRSARHLGTVTIAGTRCDHLAFRGERVDFQLFVRQGQEPVPIRFAIDYHAEAGRPQFRAQLGSWDWAPELPESLFQFLPPVGSQRVAFPELLDLLLGSTAAESEVP